MLEIAGKLFARALQKMDTGIVGKAMPFFGSQTDWSLSGKCRYIMPELRLARG